MLSTAGCAAVAEATPVAVRHASAIVAVIEDVLMVVDPFVLIVPVLLSVLVAIVQV